MVGHDIKNRILTVEEYVTDINLNIVRPMEIIIIHIHKSGKTKPDPLNSDPLH